MDKDGFKGTKHKAWNAVTCVKKRVSFPFYSNLNFLIHLFILSYEGKILGRWKKVKLVMIDGSDV